MQEETGMLKRADMPTIAATQAEVDAARAIMDGIDAAVVAVSAAISDQIAEGGFDATTEEFLASLGRFPELRVRFPELSNIPESTLVAFLDAYLPAHLSRIAPPQVSATELILHKMTSSQHEQLIEALHSLLPQETENALPCGQPSPDQLSQTSSGDPTSEHHLPMDAAAASAVLVQGTSLVETVAETTELPNGVAAVADADLFSGPLGGAANRLSAAVRRYRKANGKEDKARVLRLTLDRFGSVGVEYAARIAFSTQSEVHDWTTPFTVDPGDLYGCLSHRPDGALIEDPGDEPISRPPFAMEQILNQDGSVSYLVAVSKLSEPQVRGNFRLGRESRVIPGLLTLRGKSLRLSAPTSIIETLKEFVTSALKQLYGDYKLAQELITTKQFRHLKRLLHGQVDTERIAFPSNRPGKNHAAKVTIKRTPGGCLRDGADYRRIRKVGGATDLDSDHVRLYFTRDGADHVLVYKANRGVVAFGRSTTPQRVVDVVHFLLRGLRTFRTTAGGALPNLRGLSMRVGEPFKQSKQFSGRVARTTIR